MLSSKRRDRVPSWIVEVYRDVRGRVPILEYLDNLQLKDRARVVRVVELLEDYGPALRMPHARHLQGKLWELRVDGRPNSFRILYATISNRRFILLHIFAKKSDKTPPREIAIATRRLAAFTEGESR